MEPSKADEAAQQLQELLQDMDMFSLDMDSLTDSADSSRDDVMTAEEAEFQAQKSPRDPNQRAVHHTERAKQPVTRNTTQAAYISSTEDAPRVDAYHSTEDLGNWALMKAASRGEDDRVEELLTVSGPHTFRVDLMFVTASVQGERQQCGSVWLDTAHTGRSCGSVSSPRLSPSLGVMQHSLIVLSQT